MELLALTCLLTRVRQGPERKKMQGMQVRNIFIVIALMLSSTMGHTQEKQITLSVPENIIESGVWKYVLPRFKLKTGVRVLLGSAIEADVTIYTEETPKTGRTRSPLMVHGKSGQAFSVEQSGDGAYASRFVGWLLSDIGQRTLSGYTEEDRQVFFPAAPEDTSEVDTVMIGNVVVGEEVSIRKCGRCHVVSERNKYGGIESTPSFPALRTLHDWREKFSTFWTLNPHPSFTQIEEITEPFDPARLPHIFPIYLTIEEVENIGAFMETIEPADLGAPIQTN